MSDTAMEEAVQVSSPQPGRVPDVSSPALALSELVCFYVPGPVRLDVRATRAAAALAEAGLSVVVVDVEDGPHTAPPPADGITVRHVVMPSWFARTRFKPWYLVKMLQMLLRGLWRLLAIPADVYHASDIKALVACYLAARIRGKRLVFESYELPLEEEAVVRWRRLRAVAAFVLRGAIARCAGVIAVSTPIAEAMHRNYGGPMPIVVRNIPNYQAPPVADKLRQATGLGPDTRVALYQGGFQEDRSLDILVRAARFLPESAHIVLMGDGPSRNALEALAATEGVGDHLHILPPVPHADLLGWTASADLGLIIYPPSHSPNVRFCLPNKLFEYLMAGVPVLASPLDAVVALLQRYGVGGVVAAPDPAGIGQAIGALLADPAALARMRAHALAACARDLRWDVERTRLTTLYQNILAPRAKVETAAPAATVPWAP